MNRTLQARVASETAMAGKAKRPAQPPPRIGGVADALDALERKRRPAQAKGKPSGRKGDLDLNDIP